MNQQAGGRLLGMRMSPKQSFRAALMMKAAEAGVDRYGDSDWWPELAPLRKDERTAVKKTVAEVREKTRIKT
jgi:hypothetical protein